MKLNILFLCKFGAWEANPRSLVYSFIFSLSSAVLHDKSGHANLIAEEV
jgi:hypothetical protein